MTTNFFLLQKQYTANWKLLLLIMAVEMYNIFTYKGGYGYNNDILVQNLLHVKAA